MQLLVNLIVLSSLYCLICCGYILIYRSSRVLNLAHGEFMALGGYFLFTVSLDIFSSPVPSMLVALACSLTLGFSIYFFIMKFMTGESSFSAILVTISLGILLQGLIPVLWTSQLLHPLQNIGMENTSYEIAPGAVISTFGIMKILSAILLYLLLLLWLKFTRFGLRMRAVGENPLLASQRGIGLHRYYALSWGMGAFSAGLAGMIQACDSGLDTAMISIGLKAFPVVLVGGLDSLLGVIPGAFVVAAVEIITINYISPQASEVSPFFVLLLVLLFRPWGLFGTKEELERV